jgi:hypothetical protein
VGGSKALVPTAWTTARSPLVVRLEGTTRREDARVEETRRYRGYAFSRTDVLVPAAARRAPARGRAGDGAREPCASA